MQQHCYCHSNSTPERMVMIQLLEPALSFFRFKLKFLPCSEARYEKWRLQAASGFIMGCDSLWSPLCIEIYSLIINHETIINFQANIFPPYSPCISNKYWGIKLLFSLLKYFYCALVNHQYREEHILDMIPWSCSWYSCWCLLQTSTVAALPIKLTFITSL